MKTKAQFAIDRIQQLQLAFSSQLPERIEELELALLKLDKQLSPRNKHNQAPLKTCYELAHKLAGAAGTFQFTEVYTTAKDLEHACANFLDSNTPLTEDWFTQLLQLQKRISQSSKQKSKNLSTTSSVFSASSNDLLGSSHTNKIIIVDDDKLLSALIQEQARHFGFHIDCINNPEELADFLANNTPEVILMDIVFPNYDFTGIELVQQLQAEKKIHCPVIFLSNHHDFSARLNALRSGGSGYIVKPINILELVEVLDKHSHKTIAAATRALMIDDDADSCAVYEDILKSINFDCQTINNPLTVIEALSSFKPDIILLDIHMPNCSGYEVAQVIRQDTRFAHLPIIFLSADDNTESEIAALKAGGNCFVHKNSDRNTFINHIITQSQRSKELHAVINRLRKDELRFQAVSHSTSDAIITLNKDGLIILWNEGAEQIFGYQAIELIGQSIEIIVPSKFRDAHRKGFQKLISKNTKPGHNSIESEALHKDGHLISIELNYSEWLSGEERFFTSIIRDTTQRKETEYQLKNQQENLNAIVTNSAEGIITINARGIIEMANPKAYQIFAYDKGELEGKNITLLMPEEMRDNHAQYLSSSDSHTAKIINKPREVSGTRKDGSNFPMELSISLMSTNGERKFVGILHDITERKNTLETITNAKLAAEAANTAKSSFLSSMSHELRTPLNAVLGFSQLLQADDKAPLNPDQLESVHHIHSSGAHLLTLIDEVLDLAKIESNEVNIKLTSINLIKLLQESLSSITPQLNKANICLNSQIPKQQTIFVKADALRLTQVISNFLTNAIKYNRKQGSISVYLSQNNNKVRVFVKDTGLGIPENMMDKLFVPFNRLGAEQSDIEGTGIGLTITKMLIEMMGGKIGVENTPGEGCTFWVELDEQQDPAENPLLTPQAIEQPRPQEQENIKLLYIEDNAINRLLIKKIITSKTNLQYHEATTGHTGIQATLELKPDIILLDINLPDIDGYEIYQQLKQMDALQQSQVIIISANAMLEDIEKSKKDNFFAYLTKPIDQQQLLSTINNALAL